MSWKHEANLRWRSNGTPQLQRPETATLTEAGDKPKYCATGERTYLKRFSSRLFNTKYWIIICFLTWFSMKLNLGKESWSPASYVVPFLSHVPRHFDLVTLTALLNPWHVISPRAFFKPLTISFLTGKHSWYKKFLKLLFQKYLPSSQQWARYSLRTISYSA